MAPSTAQPSYFDFLTFLFTTPSLTWFFHASSLPSNLHRPLYLSLSIDDLVFYFIVNLSYQIVALSSSFTRSPTYNLLPSLLQPRRSSSIFPTSASAALFKEFVPLVFFFLSSPLLDRLHLHFNMLPSLSPLLQLCIPPTLFHSLSQSHHCVYVFSFLTSHSFLSPFNLSLASAISSKLLLTFILSNLRATYLTQTLRSVCMTHNSPSLACSPLLAPRTPCSPGFSPTSLAAAYQSPLSLLVHLS